MLTTLIISGGSGTRLWPASREGHPKPFIKLLDGDTLIAKTYQRAKALGTEVLTVTNRDYYFISRDEQDRVGSKGAFLLEPFARNTAAAIALGAHWALSNRPDSVMLVLPADHLIADHVRFAVAVKQAARLAEKGYLTTFGIVPTGSETGFGYIECGEPLSEGHHVARFVEKPDLRSAEGYVSSGKYLWNSGMFCFKAQVFLDELTKHAPNVAEACLVCWQAMQVPASEAVPAMLEIPAEHFESVPDISVDYAVMERSDKVAVVPGDFGWSDIGSWKAIRDLVEPDENNNRSVGESIFIESHNNFIQSEERLVATVGVNNLMIIDTRDALLVANPDMAQEVKQVVARLKRDNHDTAKLHRTVSRPWGTYTVLEDQLGFKIKRIEVKPGASLSLQMHYHRSEHWVVVAGTARVTNGEREALIQVNQSTYIPAGQMHRLENPGVIPCVLIEVQCGPYLGEDDIVRFDDAYGRVKRN